MPRLLVRLVLLAIGAFVLVDVVARLLAPWYSRWGATDEELARSWPGDDLAPDASGVATRAITIDAAASEVWRWLVQIGQDRAGFYSYTVLENLVGAGMRNADRVVEEFQHRALGDSVWLAPPPRFGRIAEQVIASYEVGHHMVLVGREDWERIRVGGPAVGSWGFVLVPPDGQTTRLVIRSRYRVRRPLFDLVHFIMERGMMRGLKERAEL